MSNTQKQFFVLIDPNQVYFDTSIEKCLNSNYIVKPKSDDKKPFFIY